MAWLVGSPETLRIQLLRSACAGILCGALEWWLFLTFVSDEATVSATLLATLWAALCSILLNYLLSVHWVFKSRNVRRQWLELKLFLLIGLSGLGLNVLTTTVLVHDGGCSNLTAKAGASLLVVAWAFTGKKLLLFSDRRASRNV
ncbi:MAG: GtrA family protein [Planctomycetes bacterium]|nr:GtrA family protein [Planctomycetota bacterium]